MDSNQVMASWYKRYSLFYHLNHLVWKSNFESGAIPVHFQKSL
jgi:hypothetical protein